LATTDLMDVFKSPAEQEVEDFFQRQYPELADFSLIHNILMFPSRRN
jgi:hypothetical protein